MSVVEKGSGWRSWPLRNGGFVTVARWGGGEPTDEFVSVLEGAGCTVMYCTVTRLSRHDDRPTGPTREHLAITQGDETFELGPRDWVGVVNGTNRLRIWARWEFPQWVQRARTVIG